MEKLKAFCCWSGGKESVLSLFYAQKKGLSVSHLVNMANSTGRISRSHGIQSSILAEQSKTIGIELIQRGASWNTYEQEFKKVIRGLKKQGVVCGVFGDIDLQEHRDWVERVCRDIGIKAILPLWQRKREELIKEFIDAGFKAVVCATNADYLGKEWLGRKVDKKFIQDLNKIIMDYDIKGIVIGNPINMDGTNGPRSQSARDFAHNLSMVTKLPITLWDERLSSEGAFTMMEELEINSSKKTAKLDQHAAAFILQGYLDYLNK